MLASFKNTYMKMANKQRHRIGVLGGGQLAMMLCEAARKVEANITILESNAQCSAYALCDNFLQGNVANPVMIRKLALEVDFITSEVEHVDAGTLSEIEQFKPPRLSEVGHQSEITTMSVPKIRPSARVMAIVQDKYLQKFTLQQAFAEKNTHLLDCLGHFSTLSNKHDLENLLHSKIWPKMVKARKGAYDGKGNFLCRGPWDVPSALIKLAKTEQIQNHEYDLYVEDYIDFACELAVIVARDVYGDMVTYPCVVTTQKDNMCHVVDHGVESWLPAETAKQAQHIAKQAVEMLGSGAVGVFGVELFLLHKNTPHSHKILINEIAPRPHNSGHYTIEVCSPSQFEQHLRCVIGLPVMEPTVYYNTAKMINLIGSEPEKEHNLFARQLEAASGLTNTFVHNYRKDQLKLGRKMGHITFVGNRDREVEDQFARWQRGVANNHIAQISTKSINNWIESNQTSTVRLVGIIMGSKSDVPVMSSAAEILKLFNISFDMAIVSAHRTPERMFQYARQARTTGLKIIIAGAGGAAHLPGMVASLTTLPVIGVPIAATHLNGHDSLLSIVQMPKGIPVATVAIDNSTNAALMAVRMLAISDPLLHQQVLSYQKKLAN